jgi:Uma2 family endonuclease
MAKSSIDPKLLERAEAAGLKLEITAGVPTWESFPGLRHQRTAERIAGKIHRPVHCECACVHAMDVDIIFPDGSYKRPDVSIWCREPDEQDGAVTLVPEAVIEVVSPSYEKKDYELNPPFYLSQGVKDVIIVNPKTGDVRLYRDDPKDFRSFTSPVRIALSCGCDVEI